MRKNFYNQMRNLKFRIWDKQFNKFLYQLPEKHHLDWGRFDVQQFTGLLVKQGKEIYEKDIVKITQQVHFDMLNKERVEILEEIWRVEWKTEWGKIGFVIPSLNIKGKEWLLTSDACLFFPPKQEEMEVIGNVWDNPELLN